MSTDTTTPTDPTTDDVERSTVLTLHLPQSVAAYAKMLLVADLIYDDVTMATADDGHTALSASGTSDAADEFVPLLIDRDTAAAATEQLASNDHPAVAALVAAVTRGIDHA